MWRVSGHSGHKNGEWELKYEGHKEGAIKVYEKTRDKMRKAGHGRIALIDHTNTVIASLWIH
jgi:hypothetical protein